MTIKDYFENTRGRGVLATADKGGRVDAAIYAAPHFIDDGTLAFIMRERLTHDNLQSNPYATYLFMAEGKGYKGVRLFLKKVREDADEELIAKMTRRHLCKEDDVALGPKFLVYFKLEKGLDLIGRGSAEFA